MKTSIRYVTLALLLLCTASVSAQTELAVVKGEVRDRETRAPLGQANVSVPGTSISTVTNDEGRFVIKAAVRPERIMVSHLGYKSRYMRIPSNDDDVVVRMQPSAIMLSEVLVSPDDPQIVLSTALSRIHDNYGKDANMMQAFYRETVQKRNRYIYVAEAVADMVKTGYHRSIRNDRVAVAKGRRLLSPRQNDTLGVKIQGGPVLAATLDAVKNGELLFNEEDMVRYQLRMGEPVKIDDRMQLVVEMEPVGNSPDALYYGRLYIDNETYAFTRIELDLDMRDRDKATRLMLVRKPLGVRFKPREMKMVVTYKSDGGKYRLNYLRTEMRFNCDWKRRLLSTSFKTVTEMVVTDVYKEPHALTGIMTFSSKDSFYDKVAYFSDSDFWRDYNIIEPTESLENAIDKLKKANQ